MWNLNIKDVDGLYLCGKIKVSEYTSSSCTIGFLSDIIYLIIVSLSIVLLFKLIDIVTPIPFYEQMNYLILIVSLNNKNDTVKS